MELFPVGNGELRIVCEKGCVSSVCQFYVLLEVFETLECWIKCVSTSDRLLRQEKGVINMD